MLAEKTRKSNPLFFHKSNLHCAKPVKNKKFFVRKVKPDNNLHQVEKNFSKTTLICFGAAQ